MELIENIKEEAKGMNGVTKIAIGVIILLMFMGLTSAELFTFDNVKTYDAQKQEITITNTFGLGGDIAKIKLNTPLIVHTGYGGVFKVAEFQTTNYKDYTNAFENIEFYNAFDLSKKITRTFEYKFKSYETISVDDYKEVCSILKNSTKICNSELIGTHEEQREVWLPLGKADFKEGEIITIGIFTYVYKYDRVEWIPTFYGVKISEWATWVGNLDTNLQVYWKFDEASGTIYDSIGNVNLTSSGAVLYGRTGKINDAIGFDASGTHFYNSTSASVFDFDLTQDLTINVWLNSSDYTYIGAPYFNAESRFMETDDGTEAGLVLRSNVQYTFRIGIGTRYLDGTAQLNNWTMATMIRNNSGTDYYMFVNGVYSSRLIGQSTTQNTAKRVIFNDARDDRYNAMFIDEFGFWKGTALTQEQITDLYNSFNGCSYGNESCFPIIPVPAVVLNSPINYFNTTNPAITFNITATDNQAITNVTLYIDNVLNQTDTSEFNGTYIFSKTLSEGSHNWSILAYNNNSQSNQSATRYLTIDIISPIVNITNPLSATYTFDYATVNNNTVFLNSTASDTHLSNCWYSSDGGVTNTSLTCNTNKTLYLPYGSYNYIVWANDTFGFLGSDSVSFTIDYKLFENSLTHTNTTLEGTNETYVFVFNKSSSLTISTIEFMYNNVSYISPYSASADYQTITKYFQVPTVTSDTNYTFYFSVLFSDGSRVNSSFHTQQVNNLAIDNCAVFTEHAFNFTLLDEEAQTILNGSIEANIQVYSYDGVTSLANYSTYINNTGYLQICIGNTTASPNYYINGVIKYKEPTHAIEYYNFVNFNYVNATKYSNISLYDLATADSTEFQIIFKDENFISLPDVLIYVNREYISESTFKTVELPKTDSGGQTIVHLVRNDVNYNIIAVKDGIVLATFNNLRAFCEDYTIGNCKLYLTATSQSFTTYNYSGDTGVSSSLDYDNSTKLITFSFVSINATSTNVNMVVWRNNYFGNTSFCNTSLTSASGSLTCNISSLINTDTVVRIEVYVNGEQILDEYENFTDREGSKDYYFLFFIFILAFVLMFIDDKTTVIIGVLIGFITAFALGLLEGKTIGIASAGIFLIIVVIIMIWKLNKERRE
ncbi:MAG: Ig-like domain-containing protein [Candidatus Staskawiczbacteria bacterium]|jgi:hypothetical protein